MTGPLEFFAAATGKLGLTAVDARRRIEVFSHLDVVRLDVDDLLGGIDLSWARAKPWSRAARDRACRDGSARLTP